MAGELAGWLLPDKNEQSQTGFPSYCQQSLEQDLDEKSQLLPPPWQIHCCMKVRLSWMEEEDRLASWRVGEEEGGAGWWLGGAQHQGEGETLESLRYESFFQNGRSSSGGLV